MLNAILSVSTGGTCGCGRRGRGMLAVLAPLLVLSAAAEGASDSGLCEATVGTAYEYDAIADHWQTKLFPVDQRWRFEQRTAKEGSQWHAVALSGPRLTLECRQRTDGRGQLVLACGEEGWIAVDLGLRVLSVALPADVEGRQRARTAVGRCTPGSG
jgi:hypothetical protein